jgi:hypothetical protein
MRTWARALVTLRAFDVLCIDVLDVYRKTHPHATFERKARCCYGGLLAFMATATVDQSD